MGSARTSAFPCVGALRRSHFCRRAGTRPDPPGCTRTLERPGHRYREPQMSEPGAERQCPHTRGAELSEEGTGALGPASWLPPPTSPIPTPAILRVSIGSGTAQRSLEGLRGGVGRGGAPLKSRPRPPLAPPPLPGSAPRGALGGGRASPGQSALGRCPGPASRCLLGGGGWQPEAGCRGARSGTGAHRVARLRASLAGLQSGCRRVGGLEQRSPRTSSGGRDPPSLLMK